MLGRIAGGIGIAALLSSLSTAASTCTPDGVQASGSIWRICMPAAEAYNGRLVVFAHGLQTAGSPVGIPEGHLELNGYSVPQLVNGLGFAFATASFSKTGLAVRQGYDDLLDLLTIFDAEHGVPERVYLIGVSMGGQIATLLQEDYPELFDATLAACGPIGDFTSQLDYFAHGRVLFEYFFPGLIPGPILDPPDALIANWPAHYAQHVRPEVLALHNRVRLNQLVRTARLPVAPANYLETAERSLRAMLDFSVRETADTIATLGGSPFDNHAHWYVGSWNDLLLNAQVARFHADALALDEIHEHYDTRGELDRPLVTMHTLLDEVVSYEHEVRYTWKTLDSPASWAQRVNLAVPRYGHCNFKLVDAALGIALLLTRAGELEQIFGLGAAFSPAELASFAERAAEHGIPYEVGGDELGVTLDEDP